MGAIASFVGQYPLLSTSQLGARLVAFTATDLRSIAAPVLERGDWRRHSSEL
jgi:hypothetical protein